MAETKFTPGPWYVARWYVRSSRDSTTVCKVIPWDETGCREDDNANLHVIKAAPEMYELLAVILANAEVIPDPRMGGATECYAVPLDDIEGIRALLLKARGEQTNKEN